MAKISTQKLMQNWEQLCNQLGDALHDPSKFDKVCKAATPFNKQYKTWYVSAGIVEIVGKKNKISSEFIIKKNRLEMLEFFLEFYREKNPIKTQDNQSEIKEKEAKPTEQIVEAKEKLDVILSLLIEGRDLECEEFDDLISTCKDVLDCLGRVIWEPDEADKVLQGLKLIASVK